MCGNGVVVRKLGCLDRVVRNRLGSSVGVRRWRTRGVGKNMLGEGDVPGYMNATGSKIQASIAFVFVGVT